MDARPELKRATLVRRLFQRAGGRRPARSRFGRALAPPGAAEAKPGRLGPALRFLAAALIPFLAALVQRAYWPHYTWALFYPAALFSSWVGGTAAGIFATLEAAALGWDFFTPADAVIAKEGYYAFVPMALFIAVGLIFSVIHGRLRKVTRDLQAATDELTELFEKASEGIFISDLSGRYTDVNSAACRLLGRSREELLGKTINDLIRPGQGERLAADREFMLKTGGVQVGEWELKRGDGSFAPVEVSASILPDGRWLAFAREVSERKRAEDASRRLIEAQRRNEFQLALEAAANAMVMVDSAGRIVLTNAEADTLFGYPQGELDGRDIEVLVPDRFKAAHPAQCAGFFQGRFARRAMGAVRILPALRKDGSEFPAEVGLTRVRLGEEALVVASVIDVTERMAFEQKLLDSEERFRLLVQSVKDYAIFMHAADGTVTVWNEGAERILGYRAEEILGRNFSVFCTPEDVAGGRPERDLKAAVELGSFQGEEWRVRKGGSRFLADVVITPVHGRDGKLLGFGKVIRDLTEVKKSEAALKGSAETLRRTAEDLEGFAYTASHDLRSPLRAIQGYAHFAHERLKGKADPESLGMLQRISSSAVRLDRLIRDVLSFSAIGRSRVALEPVDLDTIVAHVVALYPGLETARLKVRSPLGSVMAQESLMIQIVSNLLSNAVKFVPVGRVPEIGVYSERRENGKVRLTVQDNGTGIPPEHFVKIFEPFMRLPGAREAEGTGIGLAIVKKASERLNGVIHVDSEAGKGSRFTVELAEAGHAG
ncbi:MAG: PAS domain S-box protein [Elusimicrobia bacterium]|nr:PAS domain S-box protein [Elusimicrobiota bacterium]